MTSRLHLSPTRPSISRNSQSSCAVSATISPFRRAIYSSPKVTCQGKSAVLRLSEWYSTISRYTTVTWGRRMITQLLATWIPALLIALAGVMKLSGNSRLLEGMTTLGVGRYVRLLGVMELAFATLFVIPATFKLGFLLASCYFAGAIATELSHDALKVNP